MKELEYYEFCGKHGLEKTPNEAVKKIWLKYNELAREFKKITEARKYYDVCNDYSLSSCKKPKDLNQCKCRVREGAKNIRYYNKHDELVYFSTPANVVGLHGLEISEY